MPLDLKPHRLNPHFVVAYLFALDTQALAQRLDRRLLAPELLQAPNLGFDLTAEPGVLLAKGDEQCLCRRAQVLNARVDFAELGELVAQSLGGGQELRVLLLGDGRDKLLSGAQLAEVRARRRGAHSVSLLSASTVFAGVRSCSRASAGVAAMLGEASCMVMFGWSSGISGS